MEEMKVDGKVQVSGEVGQEVKRSGYDKASIIVAYAVCFASFGLTAILITKPEFFDFLDIRTGNTLKDYISAMILIGKYISIVCLVGAVVGIVLGIEGRKQNRILNGDFKFKTTGLKLNIWVLVGVILITLLAKDLVRFSMRIISRDM